MSSSDSKDADSKDADQPKSDASAAESAASGQPESDQPQSDELKSGEPQSAAAQSGRARRRWKIAGLVLAGVVALLLIVFFVLPTPVARFAINSQLDALGIEHDGVDSVDIDLWNSEVKAGPITFYAGDAEAGRLGEAGFRYDFQNLFEKRALVEVFFIRGVELLVKRQEDGTITLNGIDVAKLAAGKEPKEPEPETAEGDGFGFGVDKFEFADSTLVFQDITGGTLTFDVQRLQISDVHSWQPDQPSALSLQSRINDISWNWEGTATPFEKNIKVVLHSEIRDGTIDKVAEFTGPTGLTRQSANFESDLSYDYTIQPGGQIDGTIKGELRLADVDIATEDGSSVSFPGARIELDLTQEIKEDGTQALGGDLSLQSDSVATTGPAGEKIDLSGLKFTVEDLNFVRYAESRGGDGGDETPAPAPAPQPSDTGQPRTIVDLLLYQVEAFALRALQDRLEIDGSPSIAAAAGAFALPGTDGGPDQEIRFTDFSASAPGVDSQTEADGWSVKAAFDARLEKAWAGPAGQEDVSGIVAAGGKLSAASITAKTTDAEGTSISFDVTSSTDEVAIKDPAGMNLTLAKVTAGTPGMTVAGKEQKGHIVGPVKLGFESMESTLVSEAGDLSLTGKAFHFDAEDFDIAGDEGLSLTLSGALGLAELQMDKAGESPVKLSLDAVDVDLGSFGIDPLAAGAALEGQLNTALSNLQLALGPAGQAQDVSIAKTAIALDRLKLATAAPLTLDLAGTVDLERPRARLPQRGADGMPSGHAQDISVATASIGLDSVTLSVAEALNLELAGKLALQDTRALVTAAGETADSGETADVAADAETGESGNAAEATAADGAAAPAANSEALAGPDVSIATANIGLERLALTVAEALDLELAGKLDLQDTQAKLPTAENKTQTVTLASTALGLDRVALSTAEPLSVEAAGGLEVKDIEAALPMPNGETVDAKVGQLGLDGLEAAVAGEAVKAATNVKVDGIAVTTDAEVPQVIDVAGLAVEGIKLDPETGIAIASVLVDQLNAEITDGIAKLGGEAAAEEEGTVAEAEATEEGAAPEATPEAPATDATPFSLGRATISSGSVVQVTDSSVEPPMKLKVTFDTAEVGPVDTAKPETKTDIDLATTINDDATVAVKGWASPFLTKPSFDVAGDVAKLPLPPFSPYVSSAVGLNIDSGILNTQAKAAADAGALNGQIDVQVADLYLEPLSDEVDKEFEGKYGISANFATGLLKNQDGVIDLGFPVSGSVEEPKIDYSEVISKAIGGAMASLFPLNWFGDDGSSFEILPATFEAGSTDLTDDGKAAGDEIGHILTEKPHIGVRVCGKSTAADLIVMRGGTPPETAASDADAAPVEAGQAAEGSAAEPAAAESASEETTAEAEGADEGTAGSDGAAAAATEEQAAAPPAPLEKPSQQEVDQLLNLALKRGEVMRAYLTEAHGISPERMSECRTSYSIEDGKPPRAEFRF